MCIRDRINAEHLDLKFFLFLGSQLPKEPSILGIPIELPQPNKVNFTDISYKNKLLKLLVVILSNS